MKKRPEVFGMIALLLKLGGNFPVDLVCAESIRTGCIESRRRRGCRR